MTADHSKKHWFGFRQISPKPPGSAVPCGPYSNLAEANAERQKMKAWDASLSVVFTAESKIEAQKIAEDLTGIL